MELDITELFTEFFATNGPEQFSASRAELGKNAAQITWANAKDAGASAPLVKTKEQLDECREYFASFGAWDRDEIATWDADEINALLLQFIAGDMREGDLDADTDDDGWHEYERRDSLGEISGRIFRDDDDGRVYYYIGE